MDSFASEELPLNKKLKKRNQEAADLSELALFSPVEKPFRYVNEIFYEKTYPVGGVQPYGPLKFTIQPGTANNFIDLHNVQLFLTLELQKDKTNIGTTVVNDVVPVNQIFHSAWNHVQVDLNGVTVTDQTRGYPYKAYLQTLLSYNTRWKESTGKAIGWYNYTAPRDEKSNYKNSANSKLPTTGMLTQAHFTDFFEGTQVFDNLVASDKWYSPALETEIETWNKKGHQREFIGRLLCDVFKTERYLPPGIKVEITLHMGRPEFYLLTYDDDARNKNYNLAVKEAFIEYATVQLQTSYAHHIETRLQKAPFLFPIQNIKLQTITMKSGAKAVNLGHSLFPDLPKRVYIAHIRDEAYAGEYKLNPFFFRHEKVTGLQLWAGGKLYPPEKISNSYSGANDNYGEKETFNRLLYALGMRGGNESIGLRDQAGGNHIYAFDLTQDENHWMGHYNQDKTGELQFQLEYKTPLAHATKILIFAEFDSHIKIHGNGSIEAPFNH